MQDGFISVAAGTPEVRVGNCRFNAEACFTLMREAERAGVRVLCLPELCLTGYTCGDLFLQETLLRGAEDALETVFEATRSLDLFAVVGLPVAVEGRLYNCAAAVCRGELLGVVPKQHLPNYGEFAELRYFHAGPLAAQSITLAGRSVPFGAGLLFPCTAMKELCIGVEICEDLWVPQPPSAALAQAGATLILNLSASSELVGKIARRRSLVTEQSAKLLCAYVYANAGCGESTTDLVFSGHNLIAENGVLLAETRAFSSSLAATEVDVFRLAAERRRQNTFAPAPAQLQKIPFALTPTQTLLTRHISPTPFVPENEEDRAARCDEILLIAAEGLRRRLEHTGAKAAVIGLSGGLDSTLAILTAALAMRLMGRPACDILAVTMPCFGTTDRTRDNAVTLAEQLGTSLRRIDISRSVRAHLEEIGHSLDSFNVTFENAQARARTQVLMDLANEVGGLVVGTGDLSELALGWCTYGGDQMSMYGVNASIPKTLVRHLVGHICGDKALREPALSQVLADILDTPVSPELLPAVGGKIAQKTEDLVGPYLLHDFFIYYALRWGYAPKKILRLAVHAFAGQFDRATILKWERVFFQRFFQQQFKRSCMPDGPKVGSISLSPRGDWRMPSDASAALWLAELEDA